MSASPFFPLSHAPLNIRRGFLLVGVGSLGLTQNTEYMPSEKFNSYGYTASGEIMALGEVISGG